MPLGRLGGPPPAGPPSHVAGPHPAHIERAHSSTPQDKGGVDEWMLLEAGMCLHWATFGPNVGTNRACGDRSIRPAHRSHTHAFRPQPTATWAEGEQTTSATGARVGPVGKEGWVAGSCGVSVPGFHCKTRDGPDDISQELGSAVSHHIETYI